MDMSIALPTKATSWEVVMRAEQLGFSHAWFFDTALLTGTKAELVERLRGIKALGYEQVQFQLIPGQETDMMNRWADVMAKV